MTKLIAMAVVALTVMTPPAGRPPVGPLERHSPKVYDMRYEVTLSTVVPYRQDDPRLPRSPLETSPRSIEWGGVFQLRDTPIVMPIVYQGSYHAVDPDSIAAVLWLGDKQDLGLPGRFRMESGLPYHTHLAVLPIVEFTGRTVRWNVSYRMQSFSARIDDVRAAEIAWPREWPDEVADGLTPQMYIESSDPGFTEIVERVSQGQLRLVPPYLAAKDLVRHCVENIGVSGDGLDRGRMKILHGMELVGARETAKAGRGGPHDLVCICVAVLRAANIPARPVIGVMKHEKRGDKRLVSWAEFYLPGAGWVPFDPVEMKGKGLRHRDVRKPWPEFGTMKDLNKRIPMAYHYMPPRAVEAPQAPALWGWDPRPNDPPSAEQRIVISTVSRGSGVPDPR
ncbi:MAG: transglutaminase domain-containing protein [Planctomycetes bacterium]|nr:transglutaminase domain-containing protein [Planctomycetota bacterium]